MVDIQIASHLAKPDLHTISLAAMVRLLQDSGLPVTFTIRTLPEDIYVGPDRDPNGIKASYVDVPVLDRDGVRMQSLVSGDVPNGVRLNAIQCDSGSALPETQEALLRSAGVTARVLNGNDFHRGWLEPYLTAGMALGVKECKRDRVFVGSDDGTRTPMLLPEAIRVFQGSGEEGRAEMIRRIAPSGDLYYRAVPMHLGMFLDGHRILVESYEDDGDFLKKVRGGIAKLEQATGLSPVVVQPCWISRVDADGPVYNDIDTDYKGVSSLAVPSALLGNPEAQHEYYRFITEYVGNVVGDPSGVSMTELHRAVMEGSLVFLEK